jgi:hypothetical protein
LAFAAVGRLPGFVPANVAMKHESLPRQWGDVSVVMLQVPFVPGAARVELAVVGVERDRGRQENGDVARPQWREQRRRKRRQ